MNSPNSLFYTLDDFQTFLNKLGYHPGMILLIDLNNYRDNFPQFAARSLKLTFSLRVYPIRVIQTIPKS